MNAVIRGHRNSLDNPMFVYVRMSAHLRRTSAQCKREAYHSQKGYTKKGLQVLYATTALRTNCLPGEAQLIVCVKRVRGHP